MKTLICSRTKASLFKFEDSETITIGSDSITIGDPITTTLAGLSPGEVSLIENVVDPGDWYGKKYKYVDGNWVNNHPLDDGRTYIWQTKNYWGWDDEPNNPPTDEYLAFDKGGQLISTEGKEINKNA